MDGVGHILQQKVCKRVATATSNECQDSKVILVLVLIDTYIFGCYRLDAQGYDDIYCCTL